MSKSILTAILLAALTLTASVASAQSRTLPVSGTLTDADGKPLEGVHEVLITLHEQDAGDDSPLASQRFNVTGALMNVHMDLDDRVLADAVSGKLNYLEVTIDGEVQTPRIRLGSVPRALVADVALNATLIGGKEPAKLISEQLINPQVWTAEYPVLIRSIMGKPVIGFESCPEGSTWAVTAGIWQCAPMPSYKPSTTIDIAHDNVLAVKSNSIHGGHIRDGVITDFHIPPNAGLDPAKIEGRAAVLTSATPQNFHSNTLVLGQGRVAINKLLTANGPTLDVLGTVKGDTLRAATFEREAILTKTLHIPAAAFSSGTSSSVSTPTPWAIDRAGFGYIPAGAPSRIAALFAPLPTDLPNDATLKTLTCHYGSTSGNLWNLGAGSYAELLSRSTSSTSVNPAARLNFSTAGNPFFSNSTPITGTNTVTSGRYLYLHINFSHALPQNGDPKGGMFLGCDIAYTTSRL